MHSRKREWSAGVPDSKGRKKDVMVCGIMTDFCINATVEAGFEHGLHMIVPAYANSTQDNEYMTGEQSYHYYNEFSGQNAMRIAYPWIGIGITQKKR